MMGAVTDLSAADPFAGDDDGGFGSVDGLLAADRAGMVDGERSSDLLALERVRCRLDHEVLVQLGRWDGGQIWSADGSSSGAAWLAPRLGITGADARERVKVARWCRDAPEVLDALAACRLTYSKVAVFARFVTDGCAEAWARDAEMLVRHAAGLRVEDVTRLLRHWATLADPDKADDDEQGRQDQRTVYLAETFGGMGDLRGNLTPECLALAEALLGKVMDELYDDEQRGDIPQRTPAQRRHDAFAEILRRAAAWDPQNGRQAHPSLLFLLDYDTVANAEAARAAEEAEAATEAAEPDGAEDDGAEADAESEHGDDAEDEVAEAGEIVLVPTPEDLAARAADLDVELDDDEDADEDAPACVPAAPGPSGPRAGGGADSGANDRGAGDGRSDSGRPAAGRPGRGRGDPVVCDPNATPRFLVRGSAKATPWDGPMITAEAARRLCCDGDISRIIVGPDGEVLDHGRAKRLFTPPQRRAILKRYGFTCGWPDCDRPAGWLRIHHIDWWTRDRGPTDLDNGIPLCPCHHTCAHEGGHTLRREPTTGQITFWRPDGTQILPTNPNQALWEPDRSRRGA
jgi:hypothetical protein